MINTLKRAMKLGPLLAVAATFAIAAPALAQAPSQAQRDAIKSQCRSDYMARCSSVPPGGEASLQCLQKNMSSLSSGCQGAVRAVAAPAATKTDSAPAVATAKPAETAPPKPATTTAPATTAAPAAPAAPKSAEPKSAAGATTAQPTSAQVSAIRSACRSDYPMVCAGVPTGGGVAPGGGRIVQCLATNAGQLSPACKEVLSQFAAAR